MARNPLSYHKPSETIGVYLGNKSFYLNDTSAAYINIEREIFYDYDNPGAELILGPKVIVEWSK